MPDLKLAPLMYAITEVLSDGKPHTLSEIRVEAEEFSITTLSYPYMRILFHTLRKKLKAIEPSLDIKYVTKPGDEDHSYQLVQEVPTTLAEHKIRMVDR